MLAGEAARKLRLACSLAEADGRTGGEGGPPPNEFVAHVDASVSALVARHALGADAAHSAWLHGDGPALRCSMDDLLALRRSAGLLAEELKASSGGGAEGGEQPPLALASRAVLGVQRLLKAAIIQQHLVM